ncbi:MAG: ABC transporter ATP-binding protein [Pseudomonadota bacterium]
MSALLEARGLVKSFGPFRAVDGVDLVLESGEMLAMIGPNGAGKSTCFNLINGQLAPDAGTVFLTGREITGQPPHRLARQGLARTFQVAATFGSMSVAENVEAALCVAAGRGASLWPGGRRRYRAQALDLLERVGIAAQAERQCGLLAYGDLKRVDLALALAQTPKVLLMDEPTAGMAPGERAQLMDLVSEIARDGAIAVLFTEHDMDVVFGHARRIVVLDRGQVLTVGAPDQVRDDPRVREIYLGPDLEESC